MIPKKNECSVVKQNLLYIKYKHLFQYTTLNSNNVGKVSLQKEDLRFEFGIQLRGREVTERIDRMSQRQGTPNSHENRQKIDAF